MIDELKVSCNIAGIRGWFQGPRAEVEWKAPENLLLGHWHPAGEIALPILSFAQVPSSVLIIS